MSAEIVLMNHWTFPLSFNIFCMKAAKNTEVNKYLLLAA